MTAIIENYALINGKVIDITNNGENDEVMITVNELKNHQRYPNLINLLSANQLKVQINSNERSTIGLNNGCSVTAVVRAAAGNKYFFKPDSIQITK